MYTSQDALSSGTFASASGNDTPREEPGFTSFLDPTILQAARRIYRTYYEVHVNQTQKPLGVVINRMTLRGQLIFKQQPILLPQECFIPINQLEP